MSTCLLVQHLETGADFNSIFANGKQWSKLVRKWWLPRPSSSRFVLLQESDACLALWLVHSCNSGGPTTL
ncbi:unnamed protein product [Phytomonas sp. EM1]|nr:unnamed protein product [Phytomonas sp. EM1]|eukprot:CCW59551.1 unnamed protein product [Phytomonas sp. isolate EM1]